MSPRVSSTRPTKRRVGIALVAFALSLSVCSTADSDTAAPAVSGDTELAADAERFAALEPEEEAAQLRTVSAALERELATLSGLEEQLGGKARSDAAYTAMTTAMIARAAQLHATTGHLRFGARPRTEDAPSLGGMLFAGWLVSSLGAGVGSSNDAKPGEPLIGPEPQVDESGPTKSRIELKRNLETATLDMSLETTAQGVTGKVRSKMTINPCPTVDGTFTAKAEITASATSGGGRAGASSAVTIEITGHVDEDAHLMGYEAITNNQAAKFGDSTRPFVDVTDRSSWSGDKPTRYDRTVNRTGGNSTAEFGQQWAEMGTLTQLMIGGKMIEAAQQGWESGRCVTLEPTTDPAKRTALKPSASVSITAPPRSRIDGSKVGGSVTATLTGDSSVEPAGTKVPADATFTYIAPGEKDKRAGVALEARSKRGVGKATLDFDTYANVGWQINQELGPYRFTAARCGSERGPWKIKYTLQGIPQISEGGVVSVTFPDSSPAKATGSDKGELKAVGLPGGVRFSATVDANLTAVDETTYTMQIKQRAGTATGYAPGAEQSLQWPASGYELTVKATQNLSCSG